MKVYHTVPQVSTHWKEPKIEVSKPKRLLRGSTRRAMLRNSSDCSVSANIVVQYSGFDPEAIEAFEFAVDIWERCIVSSVPIVIHTEFQNFPGNTLGASAPAAYQKNFDNAPERNVWYPIALANALAVPISIRRCMI